MQASAMAVPEVAAEPEPEPAVLQAEDRPELVYSTFTGTTGVGIQAPESTLGEPALETDEDVAGALQSMDESQPSGLDGEKIEFEGFMFDQGTPAPLPNLRGETGVVTSGPAVPFNPDQGGPAGMVVDQDANVEGQPLPFWLNDAAQVEVTPGEGYVQAAEAAAHAGDPLVMGSVTPADAPDEDFADLPPVQPFDFSDIAGEVKEEALGFNTEELIGMSEADRDPMVVTANLEALADLIGGPLPAGIDPRHGKSTPEVAVAAAPTEGTVEMAEPPLVIPEEEEEAGAPDIQPFSVEGEAGDIGWMSTVTTDLAASGLADLAPASTAPPATSTDSTGLSGVLGVSPFDINELDMEEESSTSVLERTAMVGPNTDRLEGRPLASGPVTSPRLDEEYEGDDSETATSIFAQPMSEIEGEQAGDESPAAPAPEQPEAGVFKARVAHGRWSSAMTPPAPQAASTSAEEPESETMHSPWDGGQSGMSAGAPVQAEAELLARAAVQEPMQEPTQEPAPEHTFTMPKPGDPTVSGPLPSLTGYEDLVALMEKNPQDTGSYMAMATAYADAGEFENALRVYRRLIKRPGVSATLLNMVDEELEELRSGAGNLPRYHQVRGDLFLKLGRHREAIEECNKLV
jgi:hypothetical protein